MECHYAECPFAECHYDECHYVEYPHAECHYVKYHNAECRGAIAVSIFVIECLVLQTFQIYRQH